MLDRNYPTSKLRIFSQYKGTPEPPLSKTIILHTVAAKAIMAKKVPVHFKFEDEQACCITRRYAVVLYAIVSKIPIAVPPVTTFYVPDLMLCVLWLRAVRKMWANKMAFILCIGYEQYRISRF